MISFHGFGVDVITGLTWLVNGARVGRLVVPVAYPAFEASRWKLGSFEESYSSAVAVVRIWLVGFYKSWWTEVLVKYCILDDAVVAPYEVFLWDKSEQT